MSSLLAALQKLARTRGRMPAGDAPGKSSPAITWETVESVQENGYALVQGKPLAATGTRTFEASERVAVAWKGGRPQAILGHRWRRAQFGQTFRTTVSGIVEELLVGNLDATQTDVWYRNHEQVVKLDILGSLAGQTPQTVKWGLDGSAFAVACSNGYYAIFTLDRADPNVVDDASPGTAAFVSMHKSLDSATNLVSVTFRNSRTLSFLWFVGKRYLTYSYIKAAFNVPWFPWPLYWYWQQMWGSLVQGWRGSDASGSATASVSATKNFPLKDMLAGTITDFLGEGGKASAQVVDWYLDIDHHVKFVITASWNYFVIGSTSTGTAMLQYPWGQGPNAMDPYDVSVQVSGAASGVLGAKKQSDQHTINEQHVFLFDGTVQSVLWATAGNATQGQQVKEFQARIWEHHNTSDPGRPTCGNPCQQGTPPSDSESYYSGAFYGNPTITYARAEGFIGEQRTIPYSSTATYQLFDPALFSVVVGPYITDTPSGVEITATLIGGVTAFYSATYQVQQNQVYRSWHYRVASVQAFQANNEIRLFVVVERYPFIAGTNFINDIPQVGIFILTPDGTLVLTLRSFNFGVAGGTLITGNAHRILWVLLDGSYLNPTANYKHTKLDDGAEVSLTPAQRDTLLSGSARLYSPDFLWERVDPQPFYLMADLPEMKEDDSLDEYSKLTPVTDAPEGSVRIVNDEEILTPLDRYQAA